MQRSKLAGVIYAAQIANEIWVIHTFRKKSKQGINADVEQLKALLASEILRRSTATN
ncbi:MAG: hypothetical protein ABSF54_16580 [Bryobacteraceae bacterium]